MLVGAAAESAEAKCVLLRATTTCTAGRCVTSWVERYSNQALAMAKVAPISSVKARAAVNRRSIMMGSLRAVDAAVGLRWSEL